MASSKDRELRDLLDKYFEIWDNPGDLRRTMGYPMKPHEALFLFGLVMREQPDVIFESGTAVGWSGTWMALATDAEVFTFDIASRQRLFHPIEGKLHCTITPFQEGAPLQLHRWEGSRKLFLIDGDHTNKGFREDVEAVEPFLEPGDVIVLHDTTTEGGVRRGYAALQAKHPEWKFEDIKTVNGMAVITVQ